MASSLDESDKAEEAMEIIQDPEVEADAFRSSLDRHRELLEERIDPEFGLLDRLLEKKVITRRQRQEISAEKVPFKKNSIIINIILQSSESDKIAKFCEALKDTKQEHLVNYVHGDGEYKPQFGGNWPLSEAKVEILDDNITFLTENIDSAHGLLTLMIQKKAITQRQQESISAQLESCKRNEVLLEIIRRSSQSQLEGTIESLNASNQESIADVLIHGGMVLSLHSKAESNLPAIDPAEEEIVHQIDEIMQNKTPEETRHLLEAYLRLKNSGLMFAKHHKSIVFFFHCRSLEQLRRFLELLATEELQKSIEMLYNRILSTLSNVRVKVTWNDVEYNKAERKLQEIEPSQHIVESKVEPLHSTLESEVEPCDPNVEIRAEMTPMEGIAAAGDGGYKSDFAGTLQIEEVFMCDLTRESSEFWPKAPNADCIETPVRSDLDINAAILRNNTDFLNQHIRPRGVIDKLHAVEILSDEDTRYIKTLRHVSEKNDEMLNVIRNATSENYNIFVSYLRESGQTLVADVAEKGGVVLKLKVTHEPTSNLEEVEKEIVAKLNHLQDTTVPKSEEVWRFLSQLKRANIEIVSSRQDKGVVMWCWCHSQPALKKLDDISMSDTKQPNILNGLFALLLSGKTAPTISSVYLENPEKEVVCRKHKSIVGEKKFLTAERHAFGVAILRTKICVLCRNPNAIVVYEEGDLTKPSEDEMSLDGVVTPVDMAYSKESNWFYVTDEGKASVWKIDISSSDKKVELWLDSGAGDPFTLSVTNDGRVVMVKRGSPSSVEIYHPDSRLLLHLNLPTPLLKPNHVVETSKGNLIVSYDRDVGVPGGICELTKEGQIISRFDSMFESIDGVDVNVNKLLAHIAKQQFPGFNYLAIDETDQVYACDSGENGELAIFDSRLVLLEDRTPGLIAPRRIQYSKELTQLIVVQRNIVYTLPMHMK